MKRKFIWWLGFVALFVLFCLTAFGDNWFTYHKDFQRGGVNGASIDPNTLTLDWFFTPGVGNPLNAGFPNGTGIPIINGGQSAIVGFGKVFYGYNDASDQDVLVALDASTGAYLWSVVIRLAGLGGGFVQVPTVAERDTGGPATDTAVYVYGTNNSVWALNANTGATLWNRTGINNAAASLLSGAPIVFDTLLIIHDNGAAGAGRRFVSALNTRNGTTVWTSAQMPFRIFLGPSLSNDTVFVAGRGTGISVDSGGQINALNAHTGAVIATYDDALAINYQNGVVVYGNNLVASTRNDGTSLGSTSSIQVWHNTHDLTNAPAKFTPASFGLNRFSTPEVYVEPSVGETVIVYGTADTVPGSGTGAADIVMYRILPGFSFRSSISTVGTIHSPGAVAGRCRILVCFGWQFLRCDLCGFRSFLAQNLSQSYNWGRCHLAG